MIASPVSGQSIEKRPSLPIEYFMGHPNGDVDHWWGLRQKQKGRHKKNEE